MEKIVIFDSGIPEGEGNAIFNKAKAHSISHTLLPWAYVYEQAQKEDITFITPDIFLNNRARFHGKDVYLISHLINPHTQELIEQGVKPLLLTCQESPFIAARFYVHLKKYSKLFENSMLFPGMKKKVSSDSHFIPMFFPQFFSGESFHPLPFKKKKGIVYIASNKEVKNLGKVIIIKLLYGFSVRLIYSFRRKIIRFLSLRNDFDLYGRGWELEDASYIQKVYRGTVDNKEKKIREYKFALCLENAVFPGYITEKIFDCFFAGVIPIYLGAPDIDRYIPAETFINIKDFKSLAELEKYVDSLDEGVYETYLRNIQMFLESSLYTPFSHEYFAKTIIDLIKSA